MSRERKAESPRVSSHMPWRHISRACPDIRIFYETLPLIFHKLKNRLTPIAGYAQILQSLNADSDQRLRLQKIEENTEQLADCLDILKEYYQTQKQPRVWGRLNELIRHLQPLLNRLAREKRLKLRIRLDRSLAAQPLHPVEIDILILSLLDNAVSALDAKNAGVTDRQIEISTTRVPGGSRLKIRDSGCGIAEAELDKIWLPFFSQFPERPGLGLPVCDRIIANHGGRCEVNSQIGCFCEFDIFLPGPPLPGTQSRARRSRRTPPKNHRTGKSKIPRRTG